MVLDVKKHLKTSKILAKKIKKNPIDVSVKKKSFLNLLLIIFLISIGEGEERLQKNGQDCRKIKKNIEELNFSLWQTNNQIEAIRQDKRVKIEKERPMIVSRLHNISDDLYNKKEKLLLELYANCK